LKNCENIKRVKIALDDTDSFFQSILEYIGNNYAKHCISCEDDTELNILKYVPVKILENVEDLEDSLQNSKYASSLVYLHAVILTPKKPMDYGWDNYRDTFDDCVNLKAITFSWGDESYHKRPSMPALSVENQSIWQERMEYFKARGIQIVDVKEITDNESLRMKLAKDAGITWKFHFY
jgi:hypothetical protein